MSILKKPIFVFLPFLLLYLIFFNIFYVEGFRGDEGRYYELAQELLKGHYLQENGGFANGPGYPIFLMPFIALDVPIFFIKLVNILLHFASVLLLFYSLINNLKKKITYILTFFWASYYVAYQEMPNLLTESLTIFLVTLLLYFMVAYKHKNTKKGVFFSGLILGYLVLTKVIFGYVLLIFLLYALICRARSKDKSNNGIIMSLIALIVISPYLLYTYSITGKIYYFTTNGGSSLYWMSSPYEKEYGDWNNSDFTANCKNISKYECNSELLAINHGDFFKSISELDSVDMDYALKKAAINNIVNNPLKYAKNWINNISRLFLGMPASYLAQGERTFYRFALSSIIFVLILYSIIISVINWRFFPSNMRYTIVLLMSYLFLSSLLSAYPRNFYVIVPIVLYWFGHVFNQTIVVHPYKK